MPSRFFTRPPREHRLRTQGDGRREQSGERCFVRARRGGVLPNKKAPFFEGAFMLLLNRIFAPSPPKGRKRRGGSANTEPLFHLIEARRRRNSGVFSTKKTSLLSKKPFLLFSKTYFHFVLIQGRRKPPRWQREYRAAYRPTAERTSPADAGRRSPRAARREMFRQGKARRRRNSGAISSRRNAAMAEEIRRMPRAAGFLCLHQYPTESGSGTRTISAPSARSLFSKLA